MRRRTSTSSAQAPATSSVPPPARAWAADVGWLAAIVGVALTVRIYGPWSHVFAPTHVNLLETDAWYHLRVIENLVRQFPHRLMFDPYAAPGGMYVPIAPLFDLLVAGVAWLSGFGNPSSELIVRVAAFTPPVLGAVTVVLVYLAARLSAGSLAGLLAAAMAAILPGHFLDRTLLGFVDHHALETLLSTGVLCLAARALVEKPSVAPAGLLLGLVLAAYLLTWTSGAFLVAVVAAWLAAHAILQSGRRSGAGEATRIAGIAAIVALGVTLLVRQANPYRLGQQVTSLVILALVAAAAEIGRRGLRAGWWSPRLLAMLIVGTLGGAAAVGALAVPDWTRAVLGDLSRFTPTVETMQVHEARPLFLAEGPWSLRPAWLYFRSGFVVGLVATLVLVVRWIRRGAPTDLLFIVWTTAMYAATLGQNRFGYYLVPAVAVVGGCVSARAISAARRTGGWVRSAAVVAVAAVVFGPNLVPAIWTTDLPAGLPSEWFPAFEWLRERTPEPFGDAGYYFERYDRSPPRPIASSIMVWWDYGYWVAHAARRVPAANPTQTGAREAGRFFVETDERRARAILDERRARYVFVDDLLPFRPAASSVTGKFGTMAIWAGGATERFYRPFLFPQGRGYRAAFLFFPDYYRTMTFRLGVLGGAAVTPAGTTSVVSWTMRDFPGSGAFTVVTGARTFPTYDAAVDYLASVGAGNHAIVGQNPVQSPIPLESVGGLRRLYRTPAPGAFQQGAVQIFHVDAN